ncbi:MAG: flagellin [Candidatus Ozemobacteraceae bacterium]
MSLRINQNVTALSTYGNLNNTSNRLEVSIEKLSSGLRITKAADDAAGLAISEKMRRQIRGLDRAVLNAQDGISLIQTAEGALTETQSIIQRMRELALQSANDTLTSNDRLEIQEEIDDLRTQVDAIANSTEFNTKKLLNGNQAALVTASTHSVKGIVTGSAEGAGDFQVSLSTVSGGISQVQRSQIFTNKNTGALATGSTRLQDIAEFYDADGIFALATTQTLTVNGNADSSSIILDGQMSLNELAAEFQQAIGSASGLGISNSTASVISETATGVPGDGGYIQITSGFVGENGDFSIAASQGVIDAMGFSITRTSVNNMISANIKDAYGNSRNITTSNDTAVGLLTGINLQFSSSPAQIAGNGGMSEGIRIDDGTGAAGGESFSITFKDVDGANQSILISIANGDWSLQGIARCVNDQLDANTTPTAPATAVNAADYGFSASIQDGQVRITYAPTIPGVDSDFNLTVTAGEDSLGLLSGSYNGFVTGEKDKADILSGFSTYKEDAYASRDVLYSVNGTDATNASFTIQNDPQAADLVEINSWLSDINGDLSAAGVRVDEVNGSLAFTSLLVGYDNVSDTRSQVTLEMKSSINGAATYVADGDATTLVAARRANIDDALTEIIGVGYTIGTPALALNAGDFTTIATAAAAVGITSLSAMSIAIDGAIDSISIGATTEQRAAIIGAASKAFYTSIETGKDTKQSFGISQSIAYGSGDTNFRVHVVDTKPQFQIGADAGENMKIGIGSMTSQALGIDKIDLTSVEGAEDALEKLNKALDTVSSQRSKLGAYQNRLEYSISNLQNTATNMTAAESRIRDVDIASEMTEYTRYQILSQAGTSMLAQANSHCLKQLSRFYKAPN